MYKPLEKYLDLRRNSITVALYISKECLPTINNLYSSKNWFTDPLRHVSTKIR